MEKHHYNVGFRGENFRNYISLAVKERRFNVHPSNDGTCLFCLGNKEGELFRAVMERQQIDVAYFHFYCLDSYLFEGQVRRGRESVI